MSSPPRAWDCRRSPSSLHRPRCQNDAHYGQAEVWGSLAAVYVSSDADGALSKHLSLFSTSLKPLRHWLQSAPISKIHNKPISHNGHHSFARIGIINAPSVATASVSPSRCQGYHCLPPNASCTRRLFYL